MMTTKSQNNWFLFFSMIILPLVLGAVSSALAGNSRLIYESLNKPSFAPPGSLFGPVWSFLYICMGYAAYRVLMVGKTQGINVRGIYTVYLIHLFVNFSYSIILFRFLAIGLAFLNIVILMGLVFALILLFSRKDNIAGALMIPYIVWLTYATLLNYFIWILN